MTMTRFFGTIVWMLAMTLACDIECARADEARIKSILGDLALNVEHLRDLRIRWKSVRTSNVTADVLTKRFGFDQTALYPNQQEFETDGERIHQTTQNFTVTYRGDIVRDTFEEAFDGALLFRQTGGLNGLHLIDTLERMRKQLPAGRLYYNKYLSYAGFSIDLDHKSHKVTRLSEGGGIVDCSADKVIGDETLVTLNITSKNAWHRFDLSVNKNMSLVFSEEGTIRNGIRSDPTETIQNDQFIQVAGMALWLPMKCQARSPSKSIEGQATEYTTTIDTISEVSVEKVSPTGMTFHIKFPPGVQVHDARSSGSDLPLGEYQSYTQPGGQRELELAVEKGLTSTKSSWLTSNYQSIFNCIVLIGAIGLIAKLWIQNRRSS